LWQEPSRENASENKGKIRKELGAYAELILKTQKLEIAALVQTTFGKENLSFRSSFNLSQT